MNEKVKEIILKTLIIIEMIQLVLIFPGSMIVSFLFRDKIEYQLYESIFKTIINSFIINGILFMILLPIFGGLKQKPVKAEKFKLQFNNFKELLAFLHKSLSKKGYVKQNTINLNESESVTVYSQIIGPNILECYSIVRVSELSNELLEKVENTITEIIKKYLDGTIVTNAVNMIGIVCVDRITPAFQKLVNNNIEQSLKTSRLPVGISFGGKTIYVAKQKGGLGIISYKELRKKFIDIMGIYDKDMNDIMSRLPDVEVLFEFNGTRKNPAVDGYRPSHLIEDDYLTTGIHHYYEVDLVQPDGSAKGTITFITPEAYPHCLWIGKKINIQEGERIVGYATILDIYNPILRKK